MLNGAEFFLQINARLSFSRESARGEKGKSANESAGNTRLYRYLTRILIRRRAAYSRAVLTMYVGTLDCVPLVLLGSDIDNVTVMHYA